MDVYDIDGTHVTPPAFGELELHCCNHDSGECNWPRCHPSRISLTDNVMVVALAKKVVRFCLLRGRK